MFGIRLWTPTEKAETGLQKKDIIWIKLGASTPIRSVEISVTRDGQQLLLGNERCQRESMPFVGFSTFTNPDIHQATYLISDLLTFGGHDCISRYTRGTDDPTGQIIIAD